MTADPRSPERYFIQTGSVLVPAEVCAALNAAGLDRLRIALRGDNATVDAVLVAMRQAGLAYDTHARTIPANQREPKPRSPWVSATQAAGFLNCTPRAVQKAIAAHRLPGEKVGGHYRIHRIDLEQYRTTRRT